MKWWRNNGLVSALLTIFAVCLCAEIAAGRSELNETRTQHGAPALDLADYLASAHPWEAMLENWESEFLEMTAFMTLTVVLYQKGSAESRQPGRVELVDADPRDFAHLPDVPGPVRRGGWRLALYERSLGAVLAVFFLLSWVGHALTGWRTEISEALLDGRPPDGFLDFVVSAKFWFQTMQNWQSEFFGIASMVWLSIYLRQRGSPESKPVHASHSDTGR